MSDPLPRHLQTGLVARDLAALRLRSGAAARQALRERLVDRLGLVHGLPRKIRQLLALADPSEDPERFHEWAEESVAPAPEESLAILREALHGLGYPHLQDAFHDVSLRSIGASMGQVHCAVLHDGRKVAIKVQHPGLKEHVRSDLKALGWLGGASGGDGGLAAHRREIGEMLSAELDYHREAQHLKQFAARTRGWPSLRVPQVVDELCSDRVLTMTWLEGQSLDRAATWSQDDRDALGETLLRLFLHGLLAWGFLHADPSPGNYRFLRMDGVPSVGLLDFGCVKAVPMPLRQGFAVLARLGGDGGLSAEELFRCHVAMGFDAARLAPLKGQLAEATKILFAPFTRPGPLDPAEWAANERLSALFGQRLVDYRMAGPVDLLFVLRAFQGLGHQLRTLDARIDWQAALEQTGEEHPLAKPTPAPVPGTLHIRVTEGGTTKLNLVFGAAAADNLVDLVPESLRPGLEARGICLRSIAEEARRSAYAPAELFSAEDGARSVRAWLEP